jgi:hypothetical protein
MFDFKNNVYVIKTMSLYSSRHPVGLPQKLKLKKMYIFVGFYFTFSKFQSADFSGNVKSCHHRVYQNLCVFKSSLWREPQPASLPPPIHGYANQLAATEMG